MTAQTSTVRTAGPGLEVLTIGGHEAVLDRRTGNLIVWIGETQHVMPVSPARAEARLAIHKGASRCPDPRSFPTYEAYEAAFHLYQKAAMQPLRDALADVISADETAFIQDLKEVYA